MSLSVTLVVKSDGLADRCTVCGYYFHAHDFVTPYIIHSHLCCPFLSLCTYFMVVDIPRISLFAYSTQGLVRW